MTNPPENALLPCPHEWKECQKHYGEDDEIIYEQQCAKCQKWREEPNRPHITPVKQKKPASTDVKEAISEVEKALDFTCEYPPSDFVPVKRKYAEILIQAAQPPALPDAPARGGEVADEQDLIELVTEAMNAEWSEWCADTGCFPDDFDWKGGNGTLSFTAGKWAANVARYMFHKRKKS